MSIFDTLHAVHAEDFPKPRQDLTLDPVPVRWFESMYRRGCRMVGNRRLIFHDRVMGDLFMFDEEPVRCARARVEVVHRPKGKRKDVTFAGSKSAVIAMCWNLTRSLLDTLIQEATHTDESELLLVASFEADGGAQAFIAAAPNIYRIGLSPEIQVEQFDLENEYPEESFYLIPHPIVNHADVDGGQIKISIGGFTDFEDLASMTPRYWMDSISDWAIDNAYAGGAFNPTWQFFLHRGWPKALGLAAKVKEAFETEISPPFTPNHRLAVQIHDCRGTRHLLDYKVHQGEIA